MREEEWRDVIDAWDAPEAQTHEKRRCEKFSTMCAQERKREAKGGWNLLLPLTCAHSCAHEGTMVAAMAKKGRGRRVEEVTTKGGRRAE